MTETVSGRLPDDVVRDLDALGHATGRNRSEMLRLAVQRGLAQIRLERGVDAYRRREVSLGRGADMAGVALSTFLDVLQREGVPFHYGRTELDEDLAWANEA